MCLNNLVIYNICIPKPVLVVAVLTQIFHLRVYHGSKHDLVLNILSIMPCEKYSF